MPKPNVFAPITEGAKPYRDSHLHDFMVAHDDDSQTDIDMPEGDNHRHQFVDADGDIYTTSLANRTAEIHFHYLGTEDD